MKGKIKSKDMDEYLSRTSVSANNDLIKVMKLYTVIHDNFNNPEMKVFHDKNFIKVIEKT